MALAGLIVLVAAVAWSTYGPVASQDRARWEYCTLNAGSQVDQDTAEVRIEYFNTGDTGYRVEVVQAKSSWDSQNDNLAENAFKRAAARLGSEGWEMVHMAPDQWMRVRIVYFKRRLP
jgi:hypothetical protein